MLSTLLGALGGFFSALVKWAGVAFAWLAGYRKAKNQQIREAAETKDKQLDIASRPPKHRRSILDRMKKGDL